MLCYQPVASWGYTEGNVFEHHFSSRGSEDIFYNCSCYSCIGMCMFLIYSFSLLPLLKLLMLRCKLCRVILWSFNWDIWKPSQRFFLRKSGQFHICVFDKLLVLIMTNAFAYRERLFYFSIKKTWNCSQQTASTCCCGGTEPDLKQFQREHLMKATQKHL